MKNTLFFGGLAVAGVTLTVGFLLPQAPAAIQSNPVLQPIGSFLINNQSYFILLGLVMILLSVFV